MNKNRLLQSLTHSFFTKKNTVANTNNTTLNKSLTNKAHLAQSILDKNANRCKLLPPPSNPNKLTVVLQMDEVISYTFTPDQQGYMSCPRRKQDFHLWFEQYESLLNIYKRKNLDNFLAYLSEQCQPVLFSTGVKSYVQMVMSLIDPTRKIKHILTQQHCDRIVDEQQDLDEFVKDLGLLGRDMSKVVYIDSKPISFWLYPENGLCWQQFRADNQMKYEDLDLILLQLEQCRKRKDVREYLREQYNLLQDFKNAGLL